VRTGGTTSSDLSKQYVWGAAYVDSLVQRQSVGQVIDLIFPHIL
jgi:hypothetical protein